MKKLSIGAALVLSLLSTSAALAQNSDRGPGRMLCPRPTSETLGLKEVATPNDADFSPAANAAVQAVVGDTGINKFFRHTFQWNPRKCCQIVSATLTVTTRANQAGTTIAVSDARNDTIGIAYMGVGVPGMGGYIYNAPFAIGFVKTTVIPINAAELANMDASNRLSFNVQDDTAVTSAVLKIERCCVGKE